LEQLIVFSAAIAMLFMAVSIAETKYQEICSKRPLCFSDSYSLEKILHKIKPRLLLLYRNWIYSDSPEANKFLEDWSPIDEFIHASRDL